MVMLAWCVLQAVAQSPRITIHVNSSSAGDLSRSGNTATSAGQDSGPVVGPQVLDPIAIVQAAHPSHPRVVQWLTQWRKGFLVGKPVTADQQVELKAILNGTNLTYDILFRVGSAFRSPFRETRLAMLFAAAGAAKAHEVLSAYPPGAKEAYPILKVLDDSRYCLWDAFERGQNDAFGPTQAMNEDLVHWTLPNDPAMGYARKMSEISVAFTLASDPGEMLAAANKIEPGGGGYISSVVCLLRGNALFELGRYSEAVQPLKTCALNRGFEASDISWQPWILSSAWSGDHSGAERIFSDWITRVRPSDGAIASLRNDLDETPPPRYGDFGRIHFP
jgi:hypothetical protein